MHTYGMSCFVQDHDLWLNNDYCNLAAESLSA
jgi:hypothetical protein